MSPDRKKSWNLTESPCEWRDWALPIPSSVTAPLPKPPGGWLKSVCDTPYRIPSDKRERNNNAATLEANARQQTAPTGVLPNNQLAALNEHSDRRGVWRDSPQHGQRRRVEVSNLRFTIAFKISRNPRPLREEIPSGRGDCSPPPLELRARSLPTGTGNRPRSPSPILATARHNSPSPNAHAMVTCWQRRSER